MLTTSETLNFNDVNSELLDTSSNSCNNDGESFSDEDFLQTLSNDLDIPMLLDQNNTLLNFDVVEDDLLSEVMTSDTSWSNYDILNNFGDLDIMQLDKRLEIKLEPCNSSSPETYSDSYKSLSPTPSQSSDGSSIEIKTEHSIVDTPPVSPDSSISKTNHSKIKTKQKPKFVPVRSLRTCSDIKPVIQRVPIQPKPSCSLSPSKQRRKVPSDNFMTQSDEDLNLTPRVMNVSNIISSNTSLLHSNAGKMVVLENVPVQKMTQVVNMNPMQMPVIYANDSEPQMTTISFQSNVDAKAIKRQQRMIKNRESACLSRKKKKDYLMSLEKEVNDLKLENHKLRMENIQLKERIFGKSKGITFQLSSKTNKNTAFLLAVLFTISINVGSIGGLFNFNPQDTNILSSENAYDTDVKFGRNLLWAPEQVDSTDIPISTNISRLAKELPICPMLYVNQTESVRLAEELHRWIAKPYNGSAPSEPKRKRRLHIREKLNVGSELRPSLYRASRKARRIPQSDNELQVFWPRPDMLYAEFFEAINRRADTFYVVSFNSDNMLLPAIYHNNTRRPKMSLLLPAQLPNGTNGENISLMQIDCEVVDTRLINVKSRSIPQHFRNADNYTKDHFNPVDSNGVPSTTINATANKYYKPYFIKNGSIKSKIDSIYSQKSKKLLKYN